MDKRTLRAYVHQVRQVRHVGVLAVVAGLASLGGCAVGPNFQTPAAPVADGASYTPEPIRAQTASSPGTGGGAQRFVTGMDIPAQWWSVFQSPALDQLLRGALAQNPNMAAAEAALRQVRENYNAQAGQLVYPAVNGALGASRQKTQVATPGGTQAAVLDLYNASVNVSYTPDVFGANRLETASLAAQQQAERLQLEATYITLASNIAAAAFQDALLRRQIDVVEQMIAASGQAVALARRQRDAGYTARQELAAQQNAAAQAKQQLPPLRLQFEQNRELLRVLAGVAPGGAVPAFTLASFQLPQQLPLSLPSQLIEQRPDIRMAEEGLRAATAQAGVARAARLPQFSISATAGGAASQFGQMFWNSGKFFDVTANLLQPLFDGGTLKHRERAANAAMRGAVAAYQSAVAQAYQNVADVLHAIDAGNDALAAAQEARDAADTMRDLAVRQHANGYLDRLALIAAEQESWQAQLALAQAEASRLGDAAALFQALGGGWWHRADAGEDADANAGAAGIGTASPLLGAVSAQ